jgi:membrane protein
VTTGSLAATVLWVLAGALFSWYLAHVADYSATYGALGGAIGLMMWLWISFLVILAGAELDQEIAHEFKPDRAQRQSTDNTPFTSPDGRKRMAEPLP